MITITNSKTIKMILKWIFDRVVSLIGLLILWPLLVVVAIMIKVKMPGGPAFFVQKRVGKSGKLLPYFSAWVEASPL